MGPKRAPSDTPRCYSGWMPTIDEQAARFRDMKTIGILESDIDPFLDDEPIECGLEDPESCESCQ